MFAGQMGCEASNFVMKRIIKEERPKRTWFCCPGVWFSCDGDRFEILTTNGNV